MQANYNPTYYWVGSTDERFTISQDIHESANISIDPNSGSNTSGTKLDANWIETNFGTVNKFIFKENRNHKVSTKTGDAHLLIIYPIELTVSGISEYVLGTLAPTNQGIHFEYFSLSIGSKQYACMYLRDLTNLTFSDRDFNFSIIL